MLFVLSRLTVYEYIATIQNYFGNKFFKVVFANCDP